MDDTIRFKPPAQASDPKKVLREVYEALVEKGYNPINQIVGYLLTQDPTYITSHRDARTIICRVDRDELLSHMVREYLGVTEK